MEVLNNFFNFERVKHKTMKFVSLISLLLFFSFSNDNPVTPAEVANKYCNCATEHQLVETIKNYESATSQEEKDRAKSEYANRLRKVQLCVDINKVQESVRSLASDQRSQFEKNVFKLINQNCSEVGTALYYFRK
jgi:hypothetical protein